MLQAHIAREAKQILTLDVDLWERTFGSDPTTTRMCPDESTIVEAIGSPHSVLLAVVNSSSFHATVNASPEPLVPVKPWERELVDAGFDVCDPSLLSGLYNLDTSSMADDRQYRFRLRSNEFGLTNMGDAEHFVAVADELAPEHAPFRAMRVLARLVGA